MAVVAGESSLENRHYHNIQVSLPDINCHLSQKIKRLPPEPLLDVARGGRG